VNAGKDLVM